MGMLLGTTIVCAGVSGCCSGRLVIPVSDSVMGGAGADLPLCARSAWYGMSAPVYGSGPVLAPVRFDHPRAGGGYSARMQEHDEPEHPEDGVELVEPEDFLPGNPFPADAQRMGIDRWSDDAGMIAIASSLDPAKLSHKIVAWVMLLAVTSWLLAAAPGSS